MTAIGIDVGGTNVRVAVVDETGTLLAQSRARTPMTDGRALAAVVAQLVAEHDASLPIGMGIAGGVDRQGIVNFGPNLGAIEGTQLREHLTRELGRDVVIANDASVAVWGEHVVGAGQGHTDVVMVTLGTGVGGGAVVDGRLLVGRGLGGELGHTIIAQGGRRCSCGNDGCLEMYAAGRQFALGERSSEQVVDAARAGDQEAVRHVHEIGRWLGIGVHNVVATFDPSVVLIGGGAGQAAFDLLVGTVEETVAELILGRPHRTPPPIRPAQLGDDAGVVGAALLALDHAARSGATQTATGAAS